MQLGLLLLGLGSAYGWITTSQAVWGAKLSEIKQQMHGGIGPNAGVNGDNPTRATYTPYASQGFLWHQPEDVSESRGLGGGITYAWNPSLCGKLKFEEDIEGFSFVDCTDMRAAIARALDKWSANNRWIKFVDVTEECDMAGKLYGPPDSDPQNETLDTHGGCPLAEIWITEMYDPSTGIANSAGGAVATATPYIRLAPQDAPDPNPEFRYTNGQNPFWCDGDTSATNLESNGTCPNGASQLQRNVVETYGGTYMVNVDICWYLDSEFCTHFHNMKEFYGGGSDGAATALMVVQAATFVPMAIGIATYICIFGAFFYRGCVHAQKEDDEDGDGKLSIKEHCHGALRAIARWNPLVLTMLIMVVVVPPVLYSYIFLPCWDCSDFEATALHETGHFLGLGHPNYVPNNWQYEIDGTLYTHPDPTGLPDWQPEALYQADIYQTETWTGDAESRPNNFNCYFPWDSVKVGFPDGAEADTSYEAGYDYRNAQMEYQTQNNPQPCLQPDDLEALAVLYPDCGKQRVLTPVCHTVALNIGWARIAIYVMAPLIASLIFVISLSSVVQAFEVAEMKRLKEEGDEHLKAQKAIDNFKLAGLKIQTLRAQATANAAVERASAAQQQSTRRKAPPAGPPPTGGRSPPTGAPPTGGRKTFGLRKPPPAGPPPTTTVNYA